MYFWACQSLIKIFFVKRVYIVDSKTKVLHRQYAFRIDNMPCQLF